MGTPAAEGRHLVAATVAQGCVAPPGRTRSDMSWSVLQRKGAPVKIGCEANLMDAYSVALERDALNHIAALPHDNRVVYYPNPHFAPTAARCRSRHEWVPSAHSARWGVQSISAMDVGGCEAEGPIGWKSVRSGDAHRWAALARRSPRGSRPAGNAPFVPDGGAADGVAGSSHLGSAIGGASRRDAVPRPSRRG